MELHLANPELEAKITQWTRETGRPASELLEDAVAAYLDECQQVRQMLDRRFGELAEQRVRPIDGDEALARLKENTARQRRGE
jgi:hypothetical protein